MKKAATAMLTVAIIFSLTLSARATDEQQGVRVSDLDGLLEAIEVAQDGDTIIVTDQISVGNDAIIGCADKTIKITGAENHFLNQLFSVYSGELTMINLLIDGHGEYGAINFSGDSLKCENCAFFRCDIGVMMYNKPGQFTNCVFDSCSHPLSGANGLTMQGCRISNCTDGGGCITARGRIVIKNSLFEGNCVMKDLGVLFIEAGAYAQIRNSVFRGNRSPFGIGAAIYSNDSITMSGCVFYDNKSGLQGNDIYLYSGHLTIEDSEQSLKELYLAYGYDYRGMYLDYIDARCSGEVSLPFDDDVRGLMLCFDSLEHVEPNPAPDPVIVTEYVNVPVYVTDTVEIENVVEVEQKKETVELSALPLPICFIAARLMQRVAVLILS